jgi:hypothetical protein
MYAKDPRLSTLVKLITRLGFRSSAIFPELNRLNEPNEPPAQEPLSSEPGQAS